MRHGDPLDFEIDSDIRRAHTPPAQFYCDSGAHSAVCERVLARSWQFVGSTELARVPGAIHPFTFLPGACEEPLLLSRDDSDRLRCLSNVCTHRGNLVVDSPGTAKALRCRYHGRRFGMDGKFQSMPEFGGVEGFPAPCDDLAQVPLEAWGPFLFTALDPCVPFGEWLGPIHDRLGWLPLAEFRFDPARSRDYVVKANWALYCENYLEGFHVPYVHASLADTLDYGSYTTELHPWCNVQLGIAKDGMECFDLPKDSPDAGKAVAAYYWWLFPNLMLNFYPWGLSVNVVKPLSVAMTRVSFLSYVWDESKIGMGAGADLDRVEREDEAIVETVQRGVRSRIYSRGRYSPLREQGTHHFHRLLSKTGTGNV